MTAGWGWKSERSQGIWRHGPLWLRPFSVAAPWVALGLSLALVHIVSGTLTASDAVAFDLPESASCDEVTASPVALVLPMQHATYVFFDDSRYTLDDEASAAALREHLSRTAGRMVRKTLLVMADRRAECGDLMKVASLARASGLSRVFFAQKRPEVHQE